MKISVIIPNFDGKSLLAKNLPKVIRASRGAEIIIADDASADGSVEFIAKHFPEIKIVRKKKNTGYSSTVNAGVKSAGGELIVLLNSDVYPKKNYLAPLITYFEDPQVFAVGMVHESVENGKIVLRGRGLGRFEKGFILHSRGEISGHDTFWVNGGAGIFRKSVWDKLGGMREIYDPFYWEDIDLSRRAVKNGYTIFFEPDARVVHTQKSGAIRSNYSPGMIKLIAYRNQFLFIWLNYENTGQILNHILWLPYHILTNRETEFYLGFIDALKKYFFTSIADRHRIKII